MQHREDCTELLCNRCTAAVANSKISALKTSKISLQSSQTYLSRARNLLQSKIFWLPVACTWELSSSAAEPGCEKSIHITAGQRAQKQTLT